MAERNDLPRIKPHRTPSYLNYEMMLGGWLGSVGAGAAQLLKLTKEKTVPVMLGMTAIGMGIGAVIGKRRQEREQTEGKVVKTPSLFNDGMFAGWAAYDIAEIGYLAKTGKIDFGITNGPTRWLLTAGAVLAGGALGKLQMQQDYDQAIDAQNLQKAQQEAQIHTLQQQVAQLQNPPQPHYKDSVTAEEMSPEETVQKTQHTHTERLAQKAENTERTRA